MFPHTPFAAERRWYDLYDGVETPAPVPPTFDGKPDVGRAVNDLSTDCAEAAGWEPTHWTRNPTRPAQIDASAATRRSAPRSQTGGLPGPERTTWTSSGV
jgi:hypothetical protein